MPHVVDLAVAILMRVTLSLPIFDLALREVSIEGLAKHVRSFLDALDIPRAIVAGNSLGGHVALELVVYHPDRVSGLILTGSSGLLEPAASCAIPRQPTSEYVREKMEEAVFERSLITDAWVESMRRVLIARASALRVLQFARDARRQNMADRLGAIDVPTLLVWGREDRITPPAVAERFRSLIRGACLTYLAGFGTTRDQRIERHVLSS